MKFLASGSFLTADMALDGSTNYFLLPAVDTKNFKNLQLVIKMLGTVVSTTSGFVAIGSDLLQNGEAGNHSTYGQQAWDVQGTIDEGEMYVRQWLQFNTMPTTDMENGPHSLPFPEYANSTAVNNRIVNAKNVVIPMIPEYADIIFTQTSSQADIDCQFALFGFN